MISQELLKILACPKCKGDVFLIQGKSYLSQGEGLLCKQCNLVYPIKDDIPVMLVEEAIPYPETDSEDG